MLCKPGFSETKETPSSPQHRNTKLLSGLQAVTVVNDERQKLVVEGVRLSEWLAFYQRKFC